MIVHVHDLFLHILKVANNGPIHCGKLNPAIFRPLPSPSAAAVRRHAVGFALQG